MEGPPKPGALKTRSSSPKTILLSLHRWEFYPIVSQASNVPILSTDTLNSVYQSAVDLHLFGARGALLSGLNNEIQASLPTDPVPNQQLLSDLHRLNEYPFQGNDSFASPLEIWLSNAIQLHQNDPRADSLRAALLEAQRARLTFHSSSSSGSSTSQPPPSIKTTIQETLPPEKKPPIKTILAVAGGIAAVSLLVLIVGWYRRPKIPDMHIVFHKDQHPEEYPEEPRMDALDANAQNPAARCKGFVFCIEIPSIGYFPLGSHGIHLSQTAKGPQIIRPHKAVDCYQLKIYHLNPGTSDQYSLCKGRFEKTSDAGAEQCILESDDCQR